MDPLIAWAALAAYFLAAFLKGITGLGFSTICLGLVVSVIDIKIAIPLMILPSLASNVLVMVQAGNFGRALRRFWLLYLCTLPGLGVGLWLLGTVDSNLARGVLGGVLFAYGAWALLARSETVLPPGMARALAPPVGLITGIVNGLTGSQVMPVLPYMLSLRLDKDLFVQAINLSFTASSLVMLLGLDRLGLVSREIVALSLGGIVPVGIGIWLGGRIRRHLPDAVFRRLVLLLLVGLGLTLAVRSLWMSATLTG